MPPARWSRGISPRVTSLRTASHCTSATSLSPTTDIHGFEQRFQGRPLDDPYLCEVTITNHGPRDIGPSDFDGGHCGIAILDSAPVALLTDPAEWPFTFDTVGVNKFIITLGPCQIPAGGIARARIIVDREPQPGGRTIRLLNTRLKDRPPPSLVDLAAISGIVLVGSIVFPYAIATSSFSKPEYGVGGAAMFIALCLALLLPRMSVMLFGRRREARSESRPGTSGANQRLRRQSLLAWCCTGPAHGERAH